MWTATKTRRVIVGPEPEALAYAERQGWRPGDFLVVTDADELHRLDPPSIVSIIVLHARRLGREVYLALKEEIDILKRLWPVPVQFVTR